MDEESPGDRRSLCRLAHSSFAPKVVVYFLVAAFLKVKGEINFNNRFYLTQYIQNTII